MILAHEYKYGAQMDMPVYDATAGGFAKGQGLIWGGGADGAGSYTCLVDSAAVPIDIFAVIVNDPSVNATNFQTPDIDKAKVQMVNIVPVWKAMWDMTATSGAIDVSSSSTTQLTHGSGDDDLDGCWVYICAGTGIGQLRYCKEAAATTKDPNTAFSTAPDSTSDFLLIRGQGRPTGGQDLTATLDKLRSQVSSTGQILILKNWIQGPTGNDELDYDKHEIDGLNSRGVSFFSHICFMDTYFAVDSIGS